MLVVTRQHTFSYLSCVLQALSNYTDLVLIEAAVMCLTKIQAILGKVTLLQ